MTAPLSTAKTSLVRSARQLTGIAFALALALLCVVSPAQAQVTNYAVVPNSGDGTVSLIDTAAASPLGLAIATGGQPYCSATMSNGRYAYVTTRSNAVIRIDLAAGSVDTTIPLGTDTLCLVVTPDDQKAYVTDNAQNQVHVLDLATNTIITSINVGGLPVGLDITPDGAKVYVANIGDDSVSVIDTATNTVTATIPVGPAPYGVQVIPNGSKVFVSNNSDATLSKIDVATDTVEQTITVDSGPSTMSVSPDGVMLYVVDGNSIVDAVVVSTGTYFSGDFSHSLSAFTGIATAPNGLVWAIDANVSRLRQIDPIDAGINTSVTVGAGPVAVHSFLGPNVIASNGIGPLTIASDADLTAANFPAGYVNFNGGTLQLTGDWASSRTVSLLNGGIVDTNGHTATLSGPIIGQGSTGFVKDGNGRLIYTGTASHSGTSVIGGVLEVDGTHQPIILMGNGTLSGTGTVGIVNAQVASAATIQPGTATSTGILTADGLLAGNGTTLSFRLNGTTAGSGYDQIVGNLIDLGNATLSLSLGFVPNPGDSFRIATNVTGTFNNLPEGGIATAGGYRFRITYAGGGGADAVLAYDAPAAVTTINDISQPYTAPPQSQMVNFTVTDDFEPVTLVSATSSNQALVPNASLIVNHVCTLYSLGFMPAAHQGGQTTITVTVLDSAGNATVRAFHFTILDAAPTLQPIPDQTIHIGGILGPIVLTVSDDITDASAMGITATSSNPALLANNDIAISNGVTRMLSATPHGLGQTTITVTATDGTGHSAQQSFTLTVTPLYFLAEGATSNFFDTDILIANPNSVTAPVTLTFYKSDGSTVVHQQTLAATSRTTIHAKAIAGLEADSFSTMVDSTNDLPLVVERTMTWDSTGYGSSGEKASTGAATTWYFAEGSQGYFHTYFLLLNPNPAANIAHVAYLLEDGSSVNRDYALAATSRTTVDLATEPALANLSFGATITFDLPGMAERAMYFGESPIYSGGHDSAGVKAPATSWFLAEGATGTFFDTFVLVANPLDNPANVTMTYLPAAGAPVSKQHTLAPHQRLTINIAAEDPSLASAAVATSVASDVPVIVERSQYWPQGNWYEAHNSAGETTPGLRWGLAEGRVGGANHAQTYILIANAGAQAADITATFLRTDGTTIVKTLSVAAMSRVNLAVAGAGSDVPELIDEAFGTVIASTQPVIVERSMYTDANGIIWAAGTNATASRLP